ncbi:hypothetical protein BBF96_12565 [Anoxybacter fermentans]|uniref:Uncharacterized protein n=1 Tax=Anoxybacter fermentans TaxID=1323375 RepID=A0A3Q9HSC7_9FIRM|nr:hypothetical protein [Anoxybacter fermentans]AZR74156.1 hypothetical protein BBF96_12565 [Anoxybacter fermentans]
MGVEEGVLWGQGWHVINIGRISEVKLLDGDKTFTYIFIFPDENQGEFCSKKITAYLRELFLTKDGEIKIDFEKYIGKLKYRTMLDKSDLIAIQKGTLRFPEFFKQALKGDVTKIILF